MPDGGNNYQQLSTLSRSHSHRWKFWNELISPTFNGSVVCTGSPGCRGVAMARQASLGLTRDEESAFSAVSGQKSLSGELDDGIAICPNCLRNSSIKHYRSQSDQPYLLCNVVSTANVTKRAWDNRVDFRVKDGSGVTKGSRSSKSGSVRSSRCLFDTCAGFCLDSDNFWVAAAARFLVLDIPIQISTLTAKRTTDQQLMGFHIQLDEKKGATDEFLTSLLSMRGLAPNQIWLWPRNHFSHVEPIFL